MSKNSQDGSDEYEVIFDGASTETKKYDVIDAEVTEDVAIKSEGLELSDDDIEEGIFAPERREKQQSKKSSSLMVAVSVLALAGVGAFVYVSNPDIIRKVTENFSGGSGLTVPDEVVSTDATNSIVDPLNLTAPQQPESEVAAVAPVPAPESPENAPVVPEPLEPSHEAPNEVTPATASEPTVAPATSSVDIQAATADSETVMPTTDTLVDTGLTPVDALVEQPNVAANVAPIVEPIVAPTVAPSVAVNAPDADVVAEAPKPAAEIVKAVVPEEKQEKKVAVKQTEVKQDEVKLDVKASESKPVEAKQVEAKPVVVASKDEQKVIDDANLDKYFDSPGGKILSGIPAPSMDPKKGSRESLIIVNKKGQKTTDEKPVRSGSKNISIETTSLSAQTVSANRALKLGRYEAAKEMYDELYRLNPKDGQILAGRALLLQKMGLADQAIAAYEELLKIYPDNTDAIVNLSGLIRKQYPAVALNKLLDLHMAHPNNVFVTAQLGVAYADAGNFDDALRYLEMATTMDPQNAQHFYNMAVISEKASKPDQAVKYYEKALDVDTIYGEGHRTISREKIYDRLGQIRGN